LLGKKEAGIGEAKSGSTDVKGGSKARS